jgi:hypothetical protein
MQDQPDLLRRSDPEGFLKILGHPLKFHLFLLANLPAAYFSGVRVKKADVLSSEVSIPYRWFTRNPFRSTYFACLSMAAEMSTGILAMAHLNGLKNSVALLVVAVEGEFKKKATGKTRFLCRDGAMIRDAVEKARTTGEPVQVRIPSTGYNEKDEIVAEFFITWSFRKRRGK